MEHPGEFFERRIQGNEAILESANLPIKRFFALDNDVYRDGVLTKRTKELLGLVASVVLRCNDCVAYHLNEAVGSGVTRDEIIEALGVALVVGGSITIPHLREAMQFLDNLDEPPADGGHDELEQALD